MKGPLSALAWNALLDRISPLLRNRIMSVTTIGGAQWLHPWHTTARWNADLDRWEATVKPGFVNGLDVTVSVEAEPGAGNQEPGTKLDVPLTDSPSIPITTFRHVGTDDVSIDGSADAVPEYFRARGVGDAISFSTSDDGGIVEEITGLVDAQAEKRLLRACDLVLYHDRLATATDWLIGTGLEASQAQFSVIYKAALNARSGAYIRTTSRYATAVPADDLTRLQGNWEDQSYDTRLLATVWLLSPPGAAYDAPPDETWEPHVEHKLFWNADYITTPIALGVTKENLAVDLAGLGAAAGAQITVNQILSQQNDAMTNALEFLTKKQITGKFSTPGHRVAPEWDKTKSLNPPFPFFGLPH